MFIPDLGSEFFPSWIQNPVREVGGYVREMGGYVGSAPACYGSYQGSNPIISQKHKMGDISKGVANTLEPAKKLIIKK